MSRVIVVVPCYNEAQRLNTRKLVEFVQHESDVDLLLVDDGSHDATLEILQRLNAAYPDRFSFLHLPCNVGKAEAVRQGMQLALESEPAYVGFWDADLATPLEEVIEFARVLDRRPEIDIAVGTRIQLLGHSIRRRLARHILGRAFARLAAIVLATPLHDTQCGAKLFRVTPELLDAISAPYLTRWIFEVELFARLQVFYRADLGRQLCGAIYEYPLNSWMEMSGSKLRPLDMPHALLDMGRIWWKYCRPAAVPKLTRRPRRLAPAAPAKRAELVSSQQRKAA